MHWWRNKLIFYLLSYQSCQRLSILRAANISPRFMVSRNSLIYYSKSILFAYSRISLYCSADFSLTHFFFRADYYGQKYLFKLQPRVPLRKRLPVSSFYQITINFITTLFRVLGFRLKLGRMKKCASIKPQLKLMALWYTFCNLHTDPRKKV